MSRVVSMLPFRPTLLLLALACLLLATQAVAQSTNTLGSTTAPPTLQAPSVAYSFFRLAGALGLVTALFLGGVWLFRNGQRLVQARTGVIPRLSVIESRSLGARCGLHVVGYDEKRFLVSSGPSGVSFLTALPSAGASSPPSPATFTDALDRVAGGSQPPRAGGHNGGWSERP